MYKLYKYPILVGGDGYTVSVEKPPIVLGSPVYTRYVEQPIYFGSLIDTSNNCGTVNNQTGGIDEHVNGEVDEHVNDEVDEHVNGEVDEHVNGQVDEHVNGQVDEHVNGEVDEHVNGQVGGDGYTVSVEKPPIVLGSPVYTRYVEQPVYFGSLIDSGKTCGTGNSQTGGSVQEDVNPCADNDAMGPIRLNNQCDGKEDSVTYEDIPVGRGVCSGKHCYSIDTLRRIAIEGNNRDPQTGRLYSRREFAYTDPVGEIYARTIAILSALIQNQQAAAPVDEHANGLVDEHALATLERLADIVDEHSNSLVGGSVSQPVMTQLDSISRKLSRIARN